MANALLKRARKGQVMVSRDGRALAPDYLTIADLYGPLGTTAVSVKDSLFSVVGDVDATKKAVWQVDTQATASTMTVDVGAQTASRTITVPVLTGNRTIAVIDQAQAFSAVQTININASAVRTATAGTILQLGNVDNTVTAICIDAYGTSAVPKVDMRWATGTNATPTYPEVGGGLFQLNGWGWDQNTSAFVQQSRLIAGVSETWTATARGTKWRFFLTKNGTTSTTEAMILENSGNLLIGTNTDISGIGGLALAGTTDTTSTTSGAFQCAGGGAFAKSLTVGGTAANFVNVANATGAYKINGTQVVGPQITGYGTPTGASKLINFPGATATLAQCSAMIAQLITDFKTHGSLGA